MAPKHIAAAATVAGAAGMLAVSGAPVQIFLSVAELFKTIPDAENFTGRMLFDGVCAAFFAIGMIGTARHLIQPTVAARIALGCATVAFGAACGTIAWGNSLVAKNFSKLTQSDIVSAELYIPGCEEALAPMRIGYALVLAASGMVLAALLASPAFKEKRSLLSVFALLISVLASLLLAAAKVFGVTSSWRYHGLMRQGDSIDLVEIEESLSGVIFSVYGSSIALAGFALCCLLLALAPGRRVVGDTMQAAIVE